jgi:PadR family transcriptional regulator, regulatory protein PadR
MRQGHENALTTLEQHVMLGVAALQPKAYASALGNHIGQYAQYKPSRASVWVALPSLARRGFVRSQQGEPAPVQGGRRKFYWSLTPDGRKALAGSLKAVGKLSRVAGLHKELA